MCQLVEFARAIRLSHTLFALPFALGTALLAEPPCPEWRALVLLLACMVTARTAAMGMNRVADAVLDARNPRTADRAIPAGRLSRRAAIAMTLASGAAFIAAAWGFYLLRGNWWPGVLAPAFLVILFGYSWTKRFTALSHWVLGLCLGLAPVGVWIALRGEIALVPVAIGAAVMFWTAGFDILYALQDIEVDRREGLYSMPARRGIEAARRGALRCHVWTITCLGFALFLGPGGPDISIRSSLSLSLFRPRLFVLHAEGPANTVMGLASLTALILIAILLIIQHIRARRTSPAQIALAFFPLNAAVSIIWLAGVAADVLLHVGL